MDLPLPARKRLILKADWVKEAVGKALQERQNALRDLIHAIRKYRRLSEQLLTLRGSDYAKAAQS
jgi:hypothetical protein